MITIVPNDSAIIRIKAKDAKGGCQDPTQRGCNSPNRELKSWVKEGNRMPIRAAGLELGVVDGCSLGHP